MGIHLHAVHCRHIHVRSVVLSSTTIPLRVTLLGRHVTVIRTASSCARAENWGGLEAPLFRDAAVDFAGCRAPDAAARAGYGGSDGRFVCGWYGGASTADGTGRASGSGVTELVTGV